MIYFDDVQDKKDRTLGLPPQKIINKLLAYFKKLPFTDKRESGVKSNIISVDNLGNITWTTYKRKQKRLPPITSPPTLFYNRIMQHIPPKNFRNVRLWSCYQYQHHLRKMIKPLKESTTVKPQTCLDCKLELVPVMIVANNIIRFIKLDYKDFSAHFNNPTAPDLIGTEPPDTLKPKEAPLFAKEIREKTKIDQPLNILENDKIEIPAPNLEISGTETELFNTKTNWTKKSFLDVLYYDLGKQATDFRLCATFEKEGSPLFTKWHPYMEIIDTFHMDKVNQRTQLDDEITLDKDKGDYEELIRKLKDDGLKFYPYQTKSGRAQHIHLYFKGLSELSRNEREEIREKVIRKYGCDPMLKSDNHMIALEFCNHWKTGEPKLLLDCCEPGINRINNWG